MKRFGVGFVLLAALAAMVPSDPQAQTSSTPAPQTSWQTFLSTLSCAADVVSYSEFATAYEQLQVTIAKQVLTSTPVRVDFSTTYRAYYFKQDTITYIRIDQLDPTSISASTTSYTLKYMLFRDDADESDCFRVAPASCKYTGSDVTTYERICELERFIAYKIKQELVRLSINTAVTAIDVQTMLRDCLLSQLKVHTVTMDCTLHALDMGTDWLNVQLEAQAEKLRAQGANTTIDQSKLTYSYPS